MVSREILAQLFFNLHQIRDEYFFKFFQSVKHGQNKGTASRFSRGPRTATIQCNVVIYLSTLSNFSMLRYVGQEEIARSIRILITFRRLKI